MGAEEKKTDAETKPEAKSENEKQPNNGNLEDPPKHAKSESDPKAAPKSSSFKLPPGVNLSNSGGFKKTGTGFSRLPSGISFTSTKPTAKSDPIPPTSGPSAPAAESKIPPPTSQETPSS